MNLNEYNNRKYILLSDVTENCISLARKWNYIANQMKIENCGLENELIKIACLKQIYLYCFVTIPGISGKKWFFIWSDYLKGFMNPYASIQCHMLLVDYNDRIDFDLLVGSHPRIMVVKRSDLYVSLDEVRNFEEYGEVFAGLVLEESSISVERKNLTTISISGNHNTLNSVNQTKESTNISSICEPVDFQACKDASESTFPSTPESMIVTTDGTQSSQISEIDEENYLISQTEKQKTTKPQKKNKEKIFTRNIDTVVEASELNSLCKDDIEPVPLKRLADLQTRILSLDEIIGNRKKGIPAIIPVSKSTWYAGVKSGRYPKSFEVSEGRVAWRGSDIYAYLQQQGMCDM